MTPVDIYVVTPLGKFSAWPDGREGDVLKFSGLIPYDSTVTGLLAELNGNSIAVPSNMEGMALEKGGRVILRIPEVFLYGTDHPEWRMNRRFVFRPF